jgi:hypothetical protein
MGSFPRSANLHSRHQRLCFLLPGSVHRLSSMVTNFPV